MTRLKNVLTFLNVASGAQVALPHGLNIRGVAVTPDIYVPSSSAPFTVAVDATNVTVTNVGPSAATVTVFVEYWYSVERLFGAESVKALPSGPFGVAAAHAEVDIQFPTIRLTDPGSANRPTVVSVGATLGYIFAAGDRAHVEVPLNALLNRTQDVIIGLSWAPGGSQAGRFVTWQVDALPCELGTDLTGTGLQIIAADQPVPDTVATYTRSVITVPAAQLAGTVDELHCRIQRNANVNDPAADVALHHVAVIQRLAV